jgi:hypothetical protein
VRAVPSELTLLAQLLQLGSLLGGEQGENARPDPCHGHREVSVDR